MNPVAVKDLPPNGRSFFREKVMERRTLKFMLALSPKERAALQRLAERERLSAAAVVRRLIWREAFCDTTQLQGNCHQRAGEKS